MTDDLLDFIDSQNQKQVRRKRGLPESEVLEDAKHMSPNELMDKYATSDFRKSELFAIIMEYGLDRRCHDSLFSG